MLLLALTHWPKSYSISRLPLFRISIITFARALAVIVAHTRTVASGQSNPPHHPVHVHPAKKSAVPPALYFLNTDTVELLSFRSAGSADAYSILVIHKARSPFDIDLEPVITLAQKPAQHRELGLSRSDNCQPSSWFAVPPVASQARRRS